MPTRERVQQLVQQVETRQILPAIEEFYAEDVVMQDNKQPPRVGKAVCRTYEQGFVNSVQEIHEFRAVSFTVEGDHAAIEWIHDLTNTQGQRIRIEQIAYQTWREDQIIHERFYYDTATLAVVSAQEQAA